MKASVYDNNGKVVQELELDDAVYGVNPRQDILARTVFWQLAKRRAGTHAVKERGDVSGSTKKIVRQKGSGGARHGSKRGAQFRGGGIIFGPVVRDHSHDLPKKVRKLALRMALSQKAQTGQLILLPNFDVKSHKTKDAVKYFEKFKTSSALLVDGHEVSENMFKSIMNLDGFDILPQIGANVYDILRKDMLIMTVDAAKALEERLK